MNIQSNHRNLQTKRVPRGLGNVPQKMDAPTDTFQPSKAEPPSLMKAALGGAAVGAAASGAAVIVLADMVGAFSYMGGGGGNLGAAVGVSMAYGGVCGAVLAGVYRKHL